MAQVRGNLGTQFRSSEQATSYVTAETVLSMAQVRGNLGTQFRSSEQATSALNDLRRAQAEAEVRCF